MSIEDRTVPGAESMPQRMNPVGVALTIVWSVIMVLGLIALVLLGANSAIR